MNLTEFINEYSRHPLMSEIHSSVLHATKGKFQFRGLTGSSVLLMAANCIIKTNRLNVFILPDKEDAAYFQNDLEKIFGEEKVMFFPTSYKRSIQYTQTDHANIILRTEVLNSINDKQFQKIIVTYPEAISEKVLSSKILKDKTLEIKIGANISTDFIIDVLIEYQFERVDFVYEPGQFSLRGSIVDVFSFSSEFPYRIDFFGDQVESIRNFELETQLSKSSFDVIMLMPNIQTLHEDIERISFLEFIPSDTLIWFKEADVITDKINTIFTQTDFSDIETISKHSLILTKDDFIKQLDQFTSIDVGFVAYFKDVVQYKFNTIPQPIFNKKFDLLGNNIKENEEKGYKTILFSDNEKQIERLQVIFEDINHDIHFSSILQTIHAGFIDHDLKLCCYTDHQIFERYHRFKLKEGFSGKESITLKELTDLKPGDYVVHVDHGIGKFGGLEKIDVNGKIQESIKLVYRDNDVLFVSIHSLHRISKYKGKDAEQPKIYKLGSGAWQKLKVATKKKVKDIARDLIELYSKRKAQEGFQFSPDTYLQQELEASFIYEDTPDQIKATIAVKKAMESSFPMDLLVCGDVGFGKTEIAIRAAFKAVADNKQVAMLVPTTILALQHYNTFKERLKDFPCKVDYVSRLKPAAKQKETIKKLENGEIDILIGTHRIVGSDVKFKNMGLLIIDEEQKFGVSTKEKLRKFKENIDTLTLTATPIPRTLQFSLMGARDLSIINTPPPNRHPILTEIHSFNELIIKEAIEYEISRNGQVFFLHNRVENINEIETFLNKICPGIKTAVAHGQMKAEELEKIILEFINGDYNVLVSTAIIESGLDISNANTIIINNAHQFGLSDLYQLRGRVGRSNKRAFCYLLAPPVHLLTNDAKRRLKAIEEFSDLGSGFNIAMQDLDIRGAGNLLGGEQSGFIADIGFETYQRILNEALIELRENEFKDLFYPKEDGKEDISSDHKYIDDCQIDTDLELLFPDEYIQNIAERMRLYRRLDAMIDENSLLEFEKELTDRFGPIPNQTKELLNVVRLRWVSISFGFEKVVLKNKKMVIYFISDHESSYYQSPVFGKILEFVQKYPRLVKMKEGNNKLTITIENIDSVENAIAIVNKI